MQWKRKLSGILVAVMLVGTLPTTTFAAMDSSSGRDSATGADVQYRLEFENGLDNSDGESTSSGYNDATLDYKSGTRGNGAVLTGDSFVKLYPETENMSYSSDFSVAFWINVENIQGSDPALLGNKNWQSGNNSGWCFNLGYGSIKLNYADANGNRADISIADCDVAEEKWAHVAATFDFATDTVTTYINGELAKIESSVSLDDSLNGVGPLLLGNTYKDDNCSTLYNSSSGSCNATFTMDDFRLYQNVWSAEDVKEIYLQGVPLAGESDCYLEFDGSTSNAFGNTQDAEAIGTPSYEEGVQGQAIRLTYDQYVQLPGGTGTSDPASGDFTLAYWIKLEDTAGNDPAIMSNKNWYSGQNPGWAFVYKENTLKLNYKAVNTGNEERRDLVVCDASTLKDWTQIVATVSQASNLVSVYVNGELAVSESTASLDGGLSGEGAILLGNAYSNDGSVYNKEGLSTEFLLDEFQLLSKTMTAEEVQQSYEASAPATDPEEPGDPETVTADILNVNVSTGTMDDQSPNGIKAVEAGSPTPPIEDAEMGKIVQFNGNYDAYTYALDNEDYAAMSDSMTIEVVFKMDEIPATGEHEVFSNQQSGGVGLGVENGQIIMYCHAAGSYKTPVAPITAGEWYHVLGTYDGDAVKLYVNGKLVQSISAPGTIRWPGESSRYFVIGADSDSGGDVQYCSQSDVALARLYSTAMTAEQVKATYQALDPAVLSASGDTGRMQVNQETGVPTITASSGEKATLTDIKVDGESVLDSEYNAQTGKLTPKTLGTYTFTYTYGTQVKTLTRDCVEDLTAQVEIGVVTTDTMAEGAKYNVAVHANRGQDSEVSGVSFDLKYDTSKFEYVGMENETGTVTESDGVIHFEKNGLSEEEFNNYSATRLARLTFQVKDGITAGEASFTIENVTATDDTPIKANRTNKTVELLAQNDLDLNGDGVIGAGDVALAETTDQAKTIAQAAAIYPYKHAVVITMDGGGICFKPNEMYYASNGSTTLTDDPDILAKRTNEYAMELFNEYCATSYSAQSETPTISAQNYTSIIHGKAYATAQQAYQITNNEAGAYYYPDFGKEVAVYPSIFEALGQSFPNRGNAAFAEWTPIVNGIIEPDAPVYLHGSTKNTGDMQDVADYIKSENYKNTAMIYMQSDYMDAVGHSNGYYTDKYYTELERYDDYFKAIMDALEETGTKDETLVLFTADHGGTAGGSHGGTTNQEYDVQIALGGQTIDSGATLSGGTNHDIPQLVLAALRGDALSHMDGSADLFEAASLTQEELVEKDRAVETLTSTSGTNVNAVEFTLSDRQDGYTVNTLDLVLNLNGQEITSVDTEGTVVRQDVQDGALSLTIVYDNAAPDTLARVNLSGSADGVKVTEYMLGTDQGKEIYGDLVNTAGTLEVTPEPVQQATVTVKNGEETVATAEVTIGEDYTLPAAPTRPGYVFQGWMSSEDNQRYQAGASVTIDGDTTFTAQWEPVSRPDPDPTPNPDPDPEDPTAPSTGDAQGWQEIADELADAANGETVTVDMNGATEIPQEALEAMAGKDVALVVELEDNVQWTIRGEDLAQADAIEDLDLGVTLDTHGIPSQVVDTVAGDGTVVQFTLAHEGAFGFPMTLTVPLGRDNAGAWANLYHYNEEAGTMDLEASVRIAADGTAAFPLTHASQYAVVIDESDHSQGSGEQHPFTDVAADAWYAQAVQYVYENGLMDGIENNQFAPEHTTTRAQLVTILYRLEGQPAVTGESGFTDVEADTWYTDAVVWAAANGIVNGVSDTRFAPGDEITRQQMAAILYRYAEAKGYDVTDSADLSGYSDAETIQAYAQIPMAWACAQGLIQGFEDGTLRPAGNATRAQIATILMRFCQTVAQ